MAYGVVHFFAGGTREQYEASIAAVHPSNGGLPAGQDLSRSRPVGGRLDDNGGPRLEGELGTISRQHPDAQNAGGHRGRVRDTSSGNGHRRL